MIQTILAALLGGAVVFAAGETEFYLVNGAKVATKAEALIAKARDTKAEVYRCQAQVLTSKATLKNKGAE